MRPQTVRAVRAVRHGREPPAMNDRIGPGLLAITAPGAALAVALGVYGRLHPPAGGTIDVVGFSGPLEAKVWLATGAVVLGGLQLVTALVMYGRLRLANSSWAAGVHRWSGRVAFLLTLPVAAHCLYALGFQQTDARVLAHSLLGCAFYGAIVTKLLGLRARHLPPWGIPLLGGTVLTLLVGVWWTSSLWFFTTVGIRW